MTSPLNSWGGEQVMEIGLPLVIELAKRLTCFQSEESLSPTDLLAGRQ